MAGVARPVLTLPLQVQRHLPKHAQLKLVLQERLPRFERGAALPTIAALQAEFGLAQGTVTRVLRELQAEGLIEARQGCGVYATGKVQLKTIAIYFNFDVFAPRAGVFPRLLLQGLQAVAGAFHDVQYRYYLASGSGVSWRERVCTLERDVRAHAVDGIIAVGVYDGAFSDLPVPVVALDAPPGVTCHVRLDLESLIRQAVALLKRRACRRLALLGPGFCELPPVESPYYEAQLQARERAELFRREVRCQGLRTRTAWIHAAGRGVSSEQAQAAGASAFAAIWGAAAEKPDAVVCTDDYVAAGALQCMRDLGLVPGRDLQFVTHANRGSAVLAGQPVIPIEFDPEAVARALVTTVCELIAGGRVPAIVLVPPLVGDG